MKSTLRTILLALTTAALLAPVATRAEHESYRYRHVDHRADWLAADLAKTARQVHRQAENYYRAGRGERQLVLVLHALDDAAQAFYRSGGDEWAFERLADAYFRASDALDRVHYRAHVYGGFNRIDGLMDELFDRYGYRSDHGRDRYGRWDRDGRDRYPRDRRPHDHRRH
jgi:hypothetical protein